MKKKDFFGKKFFPDKNEEKKKTESINGLKPELGNVNKDPQKWPKRKKMFRQNCHHFLKISWNTSCIMLLAVKKI